MTFLMNESVTIDITEQHNTLFSNVKNEKEQ